MVSYNSTEAVNTASLFFPITSDTQSPYRYQQGSGRQVPSCWLTDSSSRVLPAAQRDSTLKTFLGRPGPAHSGLGSSGLRRILTFLQPRCCQPCFRVSWQLSWAGPLRRSPFLPSDHPAVPRGPQAAPSASIQPTLPRGASCPELHALFGRPSEEAVPVCPSPPLCWPVIREMWLPGARGGVLQALGSEEPHLGAALCLHSASALEGEGWEE